MIQRRVVSRPGDCEGEAGHWYENVSHVGGDREEIRWERKNMEGERRENKQRERERRPKISEEMWEKRIEEDIWRAERTLGKRMRAWIDRWKGERSKEESR